MIQDFGTQLVWLGIFCAHILWFLFSLWARLFKVFPSLTTLMMQRFCWHQLWVMRISWEYKFLQSLCKFLFIAILVFKAKPIQLVNISQLRDLSVWECLHCGTYLHLELCCLHSFFWSSHCLPAVQILHAFCHVTVVWCVLLRGKGREKALKTRWESGQMLYLDHRSTCSELQLYQKVFLGDESRLV